MNDRMKLFFLFLLSAALRLFLLGSKSLWIDECLAWGATRLGWLEMIRSIGTGTPHPPLAFVVMKLSTLAAGSGEFGLRFLIALAGASAVIPVFRLASRRTSPSGGFYAGILWAVSPFAVSLGQEAWVYGINAALSLWFADTADLAWRGSGKAYFTLFPLGILGILGQHIFILSIAVGCSLYLSVPRESRISFKKFVLVPSALALIYLPVFLYFLPQFAARGQRMAAAGATGGAGRLFSPAVPSRYFRLLFGGLVPDLTGNLLERPRMLTAYALNSAALLLLGVFPLFMAGKWKMPGLKWLWAALVIPLGLFLREEPGIRQLSVLWVPFSITSAAVFTRLRLSGPAACLFAAAGLLPYYMLQEYPYHRSNWREAVERVEAVASPEDAVVVFGGKSTSLAWEFHSKKQLQVFTPGGMLPFAGEAERTPLDPGEFLSSLIDSGSFERIWVIMDIWGIPSIRSITGEYELSNVSRAGEDMETGLIVTSP